MFGMNTKRVRSAADDSVDWGRDAYDDTSSRLDAANRRLVRMVDRARKADLPSQRRALSAVEEALGQFGDRTERTWKAVADVGQDGFDRVGKLGFDQLERLGLVRRRNWWERMGLPSVFGLGRSSMSMPMPVKLDKFDRKRLGAALAEAPGVAALSQTDLRRAGQRALDRVDFSMPEWEMPNVSMRLRPRQREWPMRTLLVGAGVVALVGYLLSSKSRRNWLMGNTQGLMNGMRKQDDGRGTDGTTAWHAQQPMPAHVDRPHRHPPVEGSSDIMRFGGLPTNGHSTGSHPTPPMSGAPLRERSVGGPSGQGGERPTNSLGTTTFVP